MSLIKSLQEITRSGNYKKNRKYLIGNFRFYFLYPSNIDAHYVFRCAINGKEYKRKLRGIKRNNWRRQMCGLQKRYRS